MLQKTEDRLMSKIDQRKKPRKKDQNALDTLIKET
jgi:hypothetical protein